jgi:putative FmdB family regulatory protein
LFILLSEGDRVSGYLSPDYRGRRAHGVAITSASTPAWWLREDPCYNRGASLAFAVTHRGTPAMPIYEYRCSDCAHQFEKLVRLNAEPSQCPQCGKATLERLFHAPAISTQKSRSYTHGIARRKASATKKEQDHAQREYERNYIKDHS